MQTEPRGEESLSAIACALMLAIVASGAVRRGRGEDKTLAVKVLREELKAFLFDPKYDDQREMLKLPNSGSVVMLSISVECVARVLAERAP